MMFELPAVVGAVESHGLTLAEDDVVGVVGPVAESEGDAVGIEDVRDEFGREGEVVVAVAAHRVPAHHVAVIV